eukprot:765149-Hanusia_phi.AAC.2
MLIGATTVQLYMNRKIAHDLARSMIFVHIAYFIVAINFVANISQDRLRAIGGFSLTSFASSSFPSLRHGG